MTSDEPELNDEPEDDVRATPPLDRGVWCVRSAGSTVYWVDLDRGRRRAGGAARDGRGPNL